MSKLRTRRVISKPFLKFMTVLRRGEKKKKTTVGPSLAGVLWYRMIPNEWDSWVLLRALLGDGSDIKNKFHKLRHACN